ncbi:hypothetical protein Sango_2758900 [Sesamum angolense]|uniref:DUF4283 domain-containing protein n=1 Tax=Sesamum angolense TaxID=2727404 RepID=A0AAE1T807_9LAMI|nr:hypothetical protein Sango_2758900 [Sesamum angolense]
MMTPWASHRTVRGCGLKRFDCRALRIQKFDAAHHADAMTATSIDVEVALLPPRPNHAPLDTPCAWALPPCVDVWALSPSILAVSIVNPPSVDSMLGLNGPSHHSRRRWLVLLRCHGIECSCHSNTQPQLHCPRRSSGLSRRPPLLRRSHCLNCLLATSNEFFFFQFKTVAAMEDVIEGGPWLYLGQPIVLRKWEPGMGLRKLKHTEVPVWIKLRHLPVELWTTEGLSTVASGIGQPLYSDAITRACTRLDFDRVDVEYEWLPPKCTGCSSLGHSTKECPLSKPTKPAVSIYVRKAMSITPAAPELKLREQVQAAPVSEEIDPETEVDRVSEEMPGHGRDKGKEIVLFNAFDLLRVTDDDLDGSSRGPNKCSPSDVSPCSIQRYGMLQDFLPSGGH